MGVLSSNDPDSQSAHCTPDCAGMARLHSPLERTLWTNRALLISDPCSLPQSTTVYHSTLKLGPVDGTPDPCAIDYLSGDSEQPLASHTRYQVSSSHRRPLSWAAQLGKHDHEESYHIRSCKIIRSSSRDNVDETTRDKLCASTSAQRRVALIATIPRYPSNWPNCRVEMLHRSPFPACHHRLRPRSLSKPFYAVHGQLVVQRSHRVLQNSSSPGKKVP